MARREYQAGIPTTLTGSGLSSTGLSFTIAENTNWPVGTNKFWVTVDPGTAQEERILCTSRSGLTVTITDGDRGQDDTNPSAHAVGATIWPSWSATDADEANEHINATTGIHGIAGGLAPLASPTFTGTVVLPSATSIGNVSATEISYVDGVTSAIQTQLNAKAPLASPTFTGTVTLPDLGSGLVPTGTIVMYGGTTAPATGGWLLCNGQSTTGYTALAAIVGANVPDLMGRAPIGYGDSADSGITTRSTIGAKVGAETHTLTTAEMPAHTHSSLQLGNAGGSTGLPVTGTVTTDTTTGSTGGGGAHNNMQPSTVVNFIIKT
jgi:microcystin-dependent protein